MEQTETHGHIIPYQTLIRIWLLLIILTAMLVVAGTVYHVALSVWAMLIVTPLKAGLVFFYFMHLKYEKPFLKAMVFATLGVLTLFIGFIFLDISYR